MGGIVRHREIEQVLNLAQVLRVGEPHERLHPAIQVAVHQVGAADIYLWIPAVDEGEDAGVLEIAPENRPNVNVAAESLDSRLHAADAAHEQFDGHTGLARPIERIDDGLVDDRVELDSNARGHAVSRVLGLDTDALDQTLAQVQRRHEQSLELLLNRVAGEFVEQPGEVLTDGAARGEKSEVLVNAACLWIVVARADVAVVLEHAVLLADHERQLAVCLEPHETVDHVHAGFLELARPGDVRRLVETGLDFHQGKHLLAGFGGLNERFDDRAVAGGAVEGLLDGKHVRIGRGLFEKSLHARGEGLVGVVEQDILARDRSEDVRCSVRFDRHELRRGRRHVPTVFERRAIDFVQLEESAEVEGSGKPIDL